MTGLASVFKWRVQPPKIFPQTWKIFSEICRILRPRVVADVPQVVLLVLGDEEVITVLKPERKTFFQIKKNKIKQRRSFFNLYFKPVGRGCGTAVEHMPCNQEVVGSEPVGGWTFFLLQSFPTFLYQRSNQVPQEGAVCCVKKWIPSCAACGKTGSITSDWKKIKPETTQDGIQQQPQNIQLKVTKQRNDLNSLVPCHSDPLGVVGF